MKKSSFVALLMGTVSGVLFALGMCMALLPEWNAFMEGVIFGGVGMVLGVITLLVWCKMENKKLPKVNGKNLLRVIYAVVAVLILGAECNGVLIALRRERLAERSEYTKNVITGGGMPRKG